MLLAKFCATFDMLGYCIAALIRTHGLLLSIALSGDNAEIPSISVPCWEQSFFCFDYWHLKLDTQRANFWRTHLFEGFILPKESVKLTVKWENISSLAGIRWIASNFSSKSDAENAGRPYIRLRRGHKEMGVSSISRM